MSYISFYRKWRPQNFKEIIGQEHNIQTIRNAISNNRLSHCYIFCGPRGTGKTSTARILAKALNCVKGATPDPCNKCDNCVSISNGSSVDVVEIDAASNRGINEIRELREKVKYLPNVLRKKIYIIDEVHMLTTEAFNALLKVLEEPPEHALFIMATTEPNKVIPTILSRCQRFDFLPIPMDKIKERLRSIARSEKVTISDAAIGLISKYADGSLRDADSILEQLAAFGEDKIDAKDVISLLGITDLDLLFKFTDILIKKSLKEGLLLVNKIIGTNQNLRIFISELIDHLYDLYVIKNYSSPFEIVNIGEDYREKYLKQAGEMDKEEIEFYMELFTDLLKQARWGEDLKVFFKSSVVKAINHKIEDKTEMGGRTPAIEAQIKSLKREVEKINSIKNDIKEFYISRNKTSKEAYKGEEEDFDIINTDEIDKMVNEVEVSSKHRVDSGRVEKNYKEKDTEGADKDEKDNETGGDEDSGIDLINDNIEKISQSLKKKKISVYAMFAEARPDRIENNVLYFSLGEKKEWHKDNLNKNSNSELISNVIKEITGKSFKIKFEIKKKNNKSNIKNDTGNSTGKKAAESRKYKKGNDKDPENPEPVKVNTGESDGAASGDDVLGYFEKKFNIKE
jgi:DNA polymerase III subunit gamma/tau